VNRIKRSLRLGVSAILLGLIAWKTDWAELVTALRRLQLELWVAAVALFGLCQVVSAERWRRMAAALGFERSLPRLISLYFIGTCFNTVLPTSVGGDVVRVWYLDNGSRRRLAAFMTVLLDRLSGLFVLLLMACLAVALSPVPLEPWIPVSVWGMTAGVFAAVLLLPLAARLFNLGEIRVQQIKTGLAVMGRPRLLAETTLLSILVQGGNVVLVWLVGIALGAEIPGSFYWIMVPMVSLLTMLPISVNGMGVREQSTVLLLAPLGVARETALSLAFLSFAAYLVNSLIGGVIYLCGGFPKPGTDPATQDSTTDLPPEHPPEELADGSVHHHPDQGRTRQPRHAA
jgi:glycosyltransferase 2 family protein